MEWYDGGVKRVAASELLDGKDDPAVSPCVSEWLSITTTAAAVSADRSGVGGLPLESRFDLCINISVWLG